jgi:hypothetical protein
MYNYVPRRSRLREVVVVVVVVKRVFGGLLLLFLGWLMLLRCKKTN